MLVDPAHQHAWRTRRRKHYIVDEQVRYAHDMTCECGAQLWQPSLDHAEPGDHEWVRATVHDHCHWVDAQWRCECGAELSEQVTRTPGSADFDEHFDPVCGDCAWLRGQR
jgi:hypothetical protein